MTVNLSRRSAKSLLMLLLMQINDAASLNGYNKST